jgi:hypothetical protein
MPETSGKYCATLAPAPKRPRSLSTHISPQSPSLCVSTEIECGELYISDGQLFRRRMQSGLEDSDTVVLEHMQESCLARIIKSEEQQLCDRC